MIYENMFEEWDECIFFKEVGLISRKIFRKSQHGKKGCKIQRISLYDLQVEFTMIFIIIMLF